MPPVDRNNPKRAATSESRYSLMEFMRDFPDDRACLEFLWVSRYATDDVGDFADCPRCKKNRRFKRYDTEQQRQSWTCTACGLHVHPTAGTIFHKSSTSLHLWFYAVYLMTSTRCGISAKQLERELGVTYKTAWRMANLIRTRLMSQDEIPPLKGQVEIDDTLVGGKARAWPKMTKQQHRWRKQMVVAAVERGGRVRAGTVFSSNQGAIHPWVRRFVFPASEIFTDEHTSYITVGRDFRSHRRIRHQQDIYVSGDVHTQTVEGFFALVKNGIRGTYHSVSKKWLDSYLNEYVWRYNHRHDRVNPFMSLLLRAIEN